jgi:hypothetical protein
MSNKRKFSLGVMVLSMITLGVLWVLPGLIFSNGQKDSGGKLKIIIPGLDTLPPHPIAKQEVRQVLEYKWDMPADSCRGPENYLWQVRFEPLPEINKPSKMYLKLKACWDEKNAREGVAPLFKEGNFFRIQAPEASLDFTQFDKPRWPYPIKKGEIFEASSTIIPRDIGRYPIAIFGGYLEIRMNFGFDENGKLVNLSDVAVFPLTNLPNYTPITDKELYIKFAGKYVTNLFHIIPPLSFGDTSIVYYRVVTKVDYPEGLKLITHDGRNIDFKMMPGPINKGDTLQGSFKAVPPHVGRNSIDLGIEEPPKEGVKPKNDSFTAQYNLLEDGKLLFIVKNQKEYNIFYKYYKSKGVQLGEY